FYGAKAEAGKHKKISGVENFKKVIRIDQSPIGRTPRSNAATYTGLFNHIREIFTATKEAKKQGYRSGHFSFNVKGGRCESCKGDGMKKIEMYFLSDVYLPCEECGGARYNEDTLKVKYREKNIAEILDLSAEEALKFFSGSGDQALLNQLAMLLKVGLGYLRLGQPATSLSGGEAQRIKLSTELSRPEKQGATLYILDEPSIGLHPRDNEKIIKMLLRLRDLDNSVLVVEHEEAFIRAADFVVDIGPGAGKFGGEVVAIGKLKDIVKSRGFTGAYLSGKLKITREKKKVDPKSGKNGFLEIFGASEFNLKNIDVKIPIARLVCLTGVSGSGKSTLLDDILGRYLSKYFYGAKAEAGKYKKITGVENFKKVIRIDQSPIGRTPRSNAATYTGLFNHIREIFTVTKEAKKQGFRAGHFSFNVKGGRCESCKGDGMKKIEMYFLSDVYLSCEECGGARYNEDTLKVKYREKNIAEILDLSVEEALKFFSESGDHALLNQLIMLLKVGLGYLRLGQPATNLSGGEAQRIKLSTELSRPEKQGATLYILDEPTVGLHPEDMRNLLNVLSELVERGNTVLLIEHNLDIIKNADWIIDMGPEGGDKGGEIVAEGTPEQVAKIKKSYTGQFLKKVLKH
ncbi:excinuclease ABC subunit UvrA, partial [Patescibacteria group bacterium]|nr:excinuclease ABC subunit UvrA [Patescibacteria group bacterium]